MPKNITEDYKKLQSRLNNRSAEKGTLNIPIHKTSKFENSVLFRTVKAWNNTSSEIRTDETHIFKRKLQAAAIHQKYSTVTP